MAPSSPPPLVGITCDFEPRTDQRGGRADRYWLSDTYVRAVAQAGGHALLLPNAAEFVPEDAPAMLAPFDALVVSGGAFDLDPADYGQAKHAWCGPLAPARTHFERGLLRCARARHMPVLGVCAGMQLMVVEAGGTLYQDVRLRPNTAVHEQPLEKAKPFHPITATPGSLLARLMGTTTFDVNSTHHQVVDAPGSLSVVARSPDGVVEGVEDPARPFDLGVQWHPEALEHGAGLALYRGLIAAARSYQARNIRAPQDA